MLESSEEQYLRRSRQSLEDIMNFKVSREAEALTGQALIDFVNSEQDLWTARADGKFSEYDEKVKNGLMGVDHTRLSSKALKNLATSRFMDIDLPASFDARQKWPACSSINLIRDQSACGSCWAFGAVEAMSDRICIASGGKTQVTISADDLLTCCSACGMGCDGGEPLAAWEFWVSDGLVTGSNYTANQGCRPYPFPPCEHHNNKTHFKPCQKSIYPTPACSKTCQASYTQRTYAKDKFYGKSAYGVEQSVQAIQKELYVNGPIELSFDVYADFPGYTSGVYMHTAGGFLGGHAVRLIGWGEENGVPYWTIANSWNTDWGMNGYFRMIRGKDDCGIESGAVAGIPDLARSPTNEHESGSFKNSLLSFLRQHRRHIYE